MQTKFPKNPTSCHVVALLLLCVSAASHTFALGSPARVPFELTGSILDSETKAPIEGAFVMAAYRELQSGGSGNVTSWCVKTKGMYTGKDGKYRFPIDKLDGYSPFETLAIKPGYQYVRAVFPKDPEWKMQDKAAYSGRDIYFTKQKPDVKDYQLSGSVEHCTHARSRADADAAIVFLKIRLSEITRLGGPLVGQITEATNSIIDRLQNLPDRPDSSK